MSADFRPDSMVELLMIFSMLVDLIQFRGRHPDATIPEEVLVDMSDELL
jgi:hypothetical protein